MALPDGPMMWHLNRFKLSAYAAYVVFAAFFLILVREFLLEGDALSTSAFGALVILTGWFSALVLREYPSRLRVEDGEVNVDFGVLAGTRRFLFLRSSDILAVSLTASWPFKVVRVRTKDRTYSWILSERPASEMTRRAMSAGRGSWLTR